MKENYLVVVSAVIITIFLVGRAGVFDAPTGLSVTDTTVPNTYAKTAHDIVKDFFPITKIEFPGGPCGDIVRDLYADVSSHPIDIQNGVSTDGPERIATINYVTDRLRNFGTIDMAYGRSILERNKVNMMISINSEAIVSVPKRSRTNFNSLHFYAVAGGGTAYVVKGRFATPSIDCAFEKEDDVTGCDCISYPISGIQVSGITQVRPPAREVNMPGR